MITIDAVPIFSAHKPATAFSFSGRCLPPRGVPLWLHLGPIPPTHSPHPSPRYGEGFGDVSKTNFGVVFFGEIMKPFLLFVSIFGNINYIRH